MLLMILRDFWLPLLYSVLKIGLLTAGVALAIVAIFYHSIFKPDYRPDGNPMPFLSFQIVRSIYNNSRKSLVLNKTFTLFALSGMCKVLERQKILALSMFGKKYVFLFTPEAAEVLLSSSRLIEKSSDYDHFRLVFRTGLFVSKGDLWRTRRRLLTPTFHFKILQNFTPLMQEVSKSLLNKFLPLVNEPWVDVNYIMRICGYSMIIKTALGLDIDIEKDDEIIKTFKASEEFSAIHFARMTRPWLYPDFIFNLTSFSKRRLECVKVMDDYVRKVMEEKKKRILASRQKNTKPKILNLLDENTLTDFINQPMNDKTNACNPSLDEGTDEEESNVYKKRKIFIDLLLDLHYKDPSFTEEDILDETHVFIGASTETLGSNLAFMMYSIGLYKDVQKKIQDELDQIFQGSDRDMVEEDLKSMKYMDCVIKESLRLFSAAFFSRRASENFKVYDYTVPEGSTVVLFTHMIHRDPKAFPNPEVFDPSRFLPENSSKIHPYAYIPFSAGPRNCIGKRFSYMTIKTILAALLKKFNITALDNRDKLYKIPENVDNLMEVPVRIKFSLRQTN